MGIHGLAISSGGAALLPLAEILGVDPEDPSVVAGNGEAGLLCVRDEALHVAVASKPGGLFGSQVRFDWSGHPLNNNTEGS